MKSQGIYATGTLIVFGLLACAEPLTTREKGAAIGTVGGATAGGIIGGAVGHPGAGAALGGVVGLGTGALIGDQLQAIEKRQSELDDQIKANDAEIQRQRQEIEKLKAQTRER